MFVLAADDEQLALEMLCECIKGEMPDAQIKAFSDPSQAIEFARANEVDIAFLDINMGTASGLDVARSVKMKSPQANIIFVTGYNEYALEALQMHASGYITKPVNRGKVREELDNLLHPVNVRLSGRYAQTFGHFEFFVDGVPVKFKREKSKELFALLVDRGGASLTTEQIASVMWEDRNYDRNLKNSLMPIIRSMQESLAEAGAEDVIIKSWGHLAVDKTKFSCDYYDYTDGKPYAINLFHGEYMSNYSWAETTLASLWFEE